MVNRKTILASELNIQGQRGVRFIQPPQSGSEVGRVVEDLSEARLLRDHYESNDMARDVGDFDIWRHECETLGLVRGDRVPYGYIDNQGDFHYYRPAVGNISGEVLQQWDQAVRRRSRMFRDMDIEVDFTYETVEQAQRAVNVHRGRVRGVNSETMERLWRNAGRQDPVRPAFEEQNGTLIVNTDLVEIPD
jgi:hypothetical protein